MELIVPETRVLVKTLKSMGSIFLAFGFLEVPWQTEFAAKL